MIMKENSRGSWLIFFILTLKLNFFNGKDFFENLPCEYEYYSGKHLEGI